LNLVGLLAASYHVLSTAPSGAIAAVTRPSESNRHSLMMWPTAGVSGSD